MKTPAGLPAPAPLQELWLESLPEVLAIERRAYSLPWSEKQLQESLAGAHRVWGLRQDGRLCAYLIWMQVVDELHILNLAVDPDCQRRGHARQLCQALLTAGAAGGAHHVFLEVRASNEAAQALYASLGLCESGRRRNYYPAVNGREDALLMGMSW